MNRRYLWAWAVYAAGGLLLVQMLWIVSAQLARLESRERIASAETARQQDIRLALWRMDARLTPLLTGEARRPATDYLAVRDPATLAPDTEPPHTPQRGLIASPVLTGAEVLDPFVRLHFQINSSGSVQSPQAPEPILLDLVSLPAEARLRAIAAREELHDLRTALDHSLASSMSSFAADVPEAAESEAAAGPSPPPAASNEQLFGFPTTQTAPPAQVQALGIAEFARVDEPQAQGELSREFQLRQRVQQYASNYIMDGDGYADSSREDNFDDVEAETESNEVTEIAAAETADEPMSASAPSPSPPAQHADRASKTYASRRAAPRDDAVPAEDELADQVTLDATDQFDAVGDTNLDDALAAGASGVRVGERSPVGAIAARRAVNSTPPVSAQPLDPADPPRVVVGALRPVWLGGPSLNNAELALVRTVRVERPAAGVLHTVTQGVWLDRAALEAELVTVARELLPGATLVPASAQADPADPSTALRLATLPLMLDPGPPAVAITSWWTPARLTLLIAWVAVLVSIGAIGVVLHRAIDLGERRGRFVSAVSHELRTPLTTFRLYSQMLASGMVPEQQQATYARTLETESERLGAIVERVLDFARLGRPDRGTGRAATPFGALFDRAEPALTRAAERASITLTFDISDAAREALVPDDPESVERVLANLVDNAAAHGQPPDGSPSRVDVTASVEVARLRVCVRDHGPGVPRRLRGRVFAPFRRGAGKAAEQTSDAAPGLGLGLAIARGLARRLGGDLRLDPNPPGRGASFSLLLPVTEPSERKK